MKKYLIGIAIIIGVGVYFYGCDKGEIPETPNVHTVNVIQNGAGLRFEWDAVDNADGYRVYADGDQVYEGTNTYYELTTPAMEVEIVAYNDEGESDPWVGDYKPVKSTGIIYERDCGEPSYPCAYGWDASTGEGDEYSLSDTTTRGRIDFYLDDFTSGQIQPANMHFVSPELGNYNQRKTWFAEGTGNIAPPIGQQAYETPYTTDPVSQQGYFFWLDRNGSESWDEGDYFVKLRVTNITNQGKVEFECWFQKKGGLRWLKTE